MCDRRRHRLPGVAGVRSAGVTPAVAGTAAPGCVGVCICGRTAAGLCNGGSVCGALAAPVVAAAGIGWIAGPGAAGCTTVAEAGSARLRATAGVTPAVAVVGRSGDWPTTGCACASCAGSTRCAVVRTGRDVVIADVGTTVAARALAKLLMVTLRLIVMLLMLVTCA